MTLPDHSPEPLQHRLHRSARERSNPLARISRRHRLHGRWRRHFGCQRALYGDRRLDGLRESCVVQRGIRPPRRRPEGAVSDTSNTALRTSGSFSHLAGLVRQLVAKASKVSEAPPNTIAHFPESGKERSTCVGAPSVTAPAPSWRSCRRRSGQHRQCQAASSVGIGRGRLPLSP
jgi:hypothetical protein